MGERPGLGLWPKPVASETQRYSRSRTIGPGAPLNRETDSETTSDLHSSGVLYPAAMSSSFAKVQATRKVSAGSQDPRSWGSLPLRQQPELPPFTNVASPCSAP